MSKNKDTDYDISVCKVQLRVEGDKEEVNRVYTAIREHGETQAMAMNQYMSSTYAFELSKILQEDDNRKTFYNMCRRVPTSNLETVYPEGTKVIKGLNFGDSIRKADKKYKDCKKHGLLHGNMSLPTYKKTNPIVINNEQIRGKSCYFLHGYDNDEQFFDSLKNERDVELYWKWVDKIMFKVILGNPRKSYQLREKFKRIFQNEILVGESSIQIKDGKIILNLTTKSPHIPVEGLKDDVTVGVDLGVAIPAMCALNNDFYKRFAIGSKDDFLRIRTQIQSQRKRMQKNVVCCRGGHGRNRKLSALERYDEHEKNFTTTYTHYVAKNVVDFALKNNAKYINMEDLTGYEDSKHFILRNWSYYQMGMYIEQLASRYGIIVRKVKPEYTSQTCSVCGSSLPDQRRSQSEFKCGNPNCKSHTMYKNAENGRFYFNADFNAARNIAMSINWAKGYGEHGKVKGKSQEE